MRNFLSCCCCGVGSSGELRRAQFNCRYCYWSCLEFDGSEASESLQMVDGCGKWLTCLECGLAGLLQQCYWDATLAGGVEGHG